MFYVFSFPPGAYVETFDLIALIPGPSILTLQGKLLNTRSCGLLASGSEYSKICCNGIKPLTLGSY